MTDCRIGNIRMKDGGAELRIFRQTPKPANEKTVKTLEYVLAEARSGRLQSVAVAGIADDMCTVSSFAVAQGDDPILLHGALAVVSDRVMKEPYEE